VVLLEIKYLLYFTILTQHKLIILKFKTCACSLVIGWHIAIMYRTCPLSRVYLLTVYNICGILNVAMNDHMTPQDEPQWLLNRQWMKSS
jgi:hypothetical protein